MPGTRKLGMVTFLLETGRIETTYTRAKEVSALTDKMVTLGKQNTLASRRQALAFLKKEEAVYKLFTFVAPLYEGRNGGYTRVLKLGPRRGDGAEMAIIELVDAESYYSPKKEKKEEKADAKAAKKAEKASKKSAKAETPKEEPKEAVKETAKAVEEPTEEAVAEPTEEPVAEAPAETVEETAAEESAEEPKE